MELSPIGLGESRERRLISQSHTSYQGRGHLLIRGPDAQATKVAVASWLPVYIPMRFDKD